MPVTYDEIDLCRTAPSDVFEQAEPAVFVLLSTDSERQHFFVSGHVHSQRGKDHRRIGLVPMTHAEMDPIEVEDTPMRLQRAFAPSGELLLQIASKPTDGTGTWGGSHQRLGHFSYFMGARARHEHLGQALGDLWFIATIALEHLAVELALAIPGHL